jgi:hypothetical protein
MQADRHSRVDVRDEVGHHYLAEAQPGGPSLWARMTTTWLGLLPTVADRGWVREWADSGWSARPERTKGALFFHFDCSNHRTPSGVMAGVCGPGGVPRRNPGPRPRAPRASSLLVAFVVGSCPPEDAGGVVSGRRPPWWVRVS